MARILPTKAQLCDISTKVYKERTEKARVAAEAAKQIEYERRANIANSFYCKLPELMIEAAKQEKFEVLINCGDGVVGETVAKLLQAYVLAEVDKGIGFTTAVWYKHDTVSNIGFGVGADEPDTKEIAYWAFKIYW